MTKKRGLFSPEIARLGVEAFDWSIASQRDKAPSGTRRDWRPGFTRGVSGTAVHRRRAPPTRTDIACLALQSRARAHPTARLDVVRGNARARPRAPRLARVVRRRRRRCATRVSALASGGRGAASRMTRRPSARPPASDATVDALLAERLAPTRTSRVRRVDARAVHAPLRARRVRVEARRWGREGEERGERVGPSVRIDDGRRGDKFGADDVAGDASGGFLKRPTHERRFDRLNEACRGADAGPARPRRRVKKTLAQLERNAISRKDSDAPGRVPVRGAGTLNR